MTTGMLEANGRYRLFTDMDQATPIEEVDKLLPFLQTGEYDIVIGSRKDKRKGAPLIRLFVSRSAIVLRKYTIGLKEISDTQCGFKLFTNEAAVDLFQGIKKLKIISKKLAVLQLHLGWILRYYIWHKYHITK